MVRAKYAKGGALLTALFIMVLVAIVATAMTMRLQLDIYRTQLLLKQDKLFLASEAVTFWSLNELNNNHIFFRTLDSQGMVSAYPSKYQFDKNVILSGGLYDLQGRFNLNNLIEQKALYSFFTVLGYLDPSIPSTERIGITQAIQDWITPYDLAKGKDIYTSYYLKQKPPYFPSHQAMVSISELRLVRGVSASIYEKLEPYITALPDPTPININTAPPALLRSLGTGIKKNQIEELIEVRGNKGIKDLKEVRELFRKWNVPEEQVTIKSTYFLSVARATKDNSSLVVYSILRRTWDKDGRPSSSVVSQYIVSE